MVNFTQAYMFLESLVKPGLTRISIVLFIFQSLVSVVQPWFTRVTRLLIRLSMQGCNAVPAAGVWMVEDWALGVLFPMSLTATARKVYRNHGDS